MQIILALILACVLPASAVGRPATENARIEYLIASVAGLQEAVFIRNGRSYNAPQAAAHLRDKLDYAGERVQTAEDFIRLCATGSWLSGRRYTIRLGNGQAIASATFLRARLAAYRPVPEGHLPGSPHP